jgi:hypothetical protein
MVAGNGAARFTATRTSMDDKQLAKLVKKLSGQSAKPKRPTKKYDSTLDATKPPETPANEDAADLFKEMKRREF